MAESETKQDEEPHEGEEEEAAEESATERDAGDVRDSDAGAPDERDDAPEDGEPHEESVDEAEDESVGIERPPPATSRRQFLDTAIFGGTVVVGVASAYPAVRFLEPAAEGARATSATVARVDDFPAGTAKSARLGETPILVVRDAEGTFRAYNAVCPHLQCIVRYAQQKGEIACACHGGRFSLAGSPKGGPPKQPLEVLRVNVVAGDVVVTKA